MKQPALLMLAILILGCENQNPVAELDEEIIAASSVADGDTDVDPQPLNRDGIRITFSDRIALSHFNLHKEDSTSLQWRTEWAADGQTVTLTPPHRCALLRYGKTYTIDFVVQDFGAWKIEDTIIFKTKPQSVNASSFDPPVFTGG